jgi:hypothetical protein
LARAERLGYDVKDIVQEHNEHVIPSLHSLPVQPQPQPMGPLTNTALSARQYHTPPVASQTPPPPRQASRARLVQVWLAMCFASGTRLCKLPIQTSQLDLSNSE